MNILHISRTMGQGGAEKVVYQICKGCNDEKIKMYIASTGGSLSEELKNEGIVHIDIPDIDKKNPFLIIKTIFVLNKAIKKFDINIIHSHHRMAAFYSRILCFFNKNVKRIYTAHNVFEDKKKLTIFSLKGSEVIAVGDSVYRNIVDFYNINKKNVKLIYNSIEVPKKINTPQDGLFKKKNKRIYVGTIGRLSRQKGIDIFLKSMKKVIETNKNVYALVIGDGELKEDLNNLAKELHITNNVFFLGYRKDMFDLLSQLDFVVLPSRWEGFPLTILETFVSRKTIIASNIPGNNDIVINGENGLLFKKDDYNDLADKINYLLKNDKIIKKMSAQAEKDYKEKYEYNIFLESHKKTYEDLMNNRM